MSKEQQYFWKYNQSFPTSVQHAFVTEEASSAICGSTLLWYVPKGWASDLKGLNSRKSCKRCLGIIHN